MLPRRRIVERLSAQIDGGVVLISGDAGSGKSTLLALLEQESGVPVVRVALSSAAEDAGMLLRAIRDALGLDVPDATLEHAAPAETATRLRDGMAERAPLVLALDDAHRLSRSPPALETLATLAADLPPDVGLIVASRGPVPLALGRLRTQGRLDEVTADDLVLSIDEVRTLVSGTAIRVEVGEEIARRIHAATSGWLVAVLLIAQSLKLRGAGPTLEALDAADRPLADYLTEAVLARLPAATVHALEASAALEPFDRPLLFATLGPGAAEVLDAGLQEHLVVDEGGGRFSFSARIGEIMRRRLAERPEDLRDIHRRAARALLERSDLDRAIHHSLEAGDEDVAVHLLATTGHASLSHNRIRSLGRHLDRLDPSRIEAIPSLRFARATVRMMRSEVERAVRDFEAVAGGGGGPLAAGAASRLAYLSSWRGRFGDAEQWSRRALAHAPELPDAISVYAHALLASALHHQGRPVEAQAVGAALAESEAPYPANAIGPFNDGLVYRLLGRHEDERALALDWIERERTSPLRLSLPSFLMLAAGAEVALGRFREGLGWADEGIALALSSDAPWWAPPCRLARAEALAGLGRRDEAHEEAERTLEACRARSMSWTEAEALLLCASLDDDPLPRVEQAWQSASLTQHPALRARVQAARARLALDRGDATGGAEALAAARRELGPVAAEEVRRSIELLQGRQARLEGRREDALRSVAAELREGPALRRERVGLVPLLIDLSQAGSAEARRELRAAGAAALPRLSRWRSNVAAAVIDEIYEDEAGPLEVRSLGRFRLLRRHRARDYAEPLRLRTPKVVELFWMLLLARGRPVPRDALLDALWPEEPMQVALNRLHVHLSHLRHGLEPHLIGRARSRYVVREAGGYALDLRGGGCDAFRFEEDARAGLAALREGRSEPAEALLVAALERHEGPLWGDRPAPERIEAERQRLADLFAEVAVAAAGCARARGEFSAAHERLEALLSLSPANEAAYRGLMEIAADQGRRNRIHATLGRCRRVLASTLGVEPEARTEALAAALAADLDRTGAGATRRAPGHS